MRRVKLLEWIGFRYIVNHHSKEIHRVSSLTKNCFFSRMNTAGYATKLWVGRLLKRGYNGCWHCFREKNINY